MTGAGQVDATRSAADPDTEPSAGGPAAWRPDAALLVGAAFTLAAAAVAVRIRPVVLYDDAAIIGRYIARIVDGQGWTYNDGDRTNGLSAPLYGMVAALVHASGLDPITSLRLVCTASYAATIGLVAYLGVRVVGLVGGLAAGAYLLVWQDYSSQGLSGMESSFATLLGVATLVALVHDRETAAGVLLGLALVNKLDAGLLALAIAAVFVLVRRRAPWRLAAVSAAVAAPWFAFATWYFGSPLPHSFSQKVSGEVVNAAVAPSRTWILAGLRGQQVVPLVLLALAGGTVVTIALVRRGRMPAAVALGSAVGWAVAHGLAFSLMDLGDRYPWYLTALYPPLALAAGCTVGAVFSQVRSRAVGLPAPAVLGLGAAGLLFAATTAVGTARLGFTETLARQVRAGPPTNDYLRFEQARREAGIRVADLAEPGDVVATCFGWVAYEALAHPIEETCPLNTREPVDPARWLVEVHYPDTGQPARPGTVASIRSDGVDIDGRIDIVRIDP